MHQHQIDIFQLQILQHLCHRFRRFFFPVRSRPQLGRHPNFAAVNLVVIHGNLQGLSNPGVVQIEIGRINMTATETEIMQNRATDRFRIVRRVPTTHTNALLGNFIGCQLDFGEAGVSCGGRLVLAFSCLRNGRCSRQQNKLFFLGTRLHYNFEGQRRNRRFRKSTAPDGWYISFEGRVDHGKESSLGIGLNVEPSHKDGNRQYHKRYQAGAQEACQESNHL